MRSILAWCLAGALLLQAGAALAAPPAAGKGATAADEATRTMRGEVMTVNEARGALTLKTAEGELDLRLPPTAIRGIKKGDRVVVRVVVHEAGSTAAPKRAPAPKGH